MQRDHALDADIQQTEQHEPHREAEVAEQSPRRGDDHDIDAGDRSRFFSVANALLAAIHPHTPELRQPETLTRREAEALKLIYEAKTGRETEMAAGHLSAHERMRYLQLGLGALQRVLAMARHPDFVQARAHIEEIRKRLARLKDELQQEIVDEDRRGYAAPKAPDELKKDEDEAGKKKDAEAVETSG